MKLKHLFLLLIVMTSMSAMAQFDPESGRPETPESTAPVIEKKIKSWRMVDGYTLADSLALDTMLTSFQRHNPVLYQSPFNLFTGNLGSPYQSFVLSNLQDNQDFFFANAYQIYLPGPDEMVYYNTTVPYTNLSYQSGAPKRRSEEHINILFTQNINSKLNAGIQYNLLSCIGRYSSQRVENRMFRYFMSYNSKLYSAHGSIILNKIDQYENGGITDTDIILNPQNYSGYENKEYIPVYLQNTKNILYNQRYFLSHSLNIGQISIADTTVEEKKLPIGTAFHSIEVNRYQRRFEISDLATDNATGTDAEYFKKIYYDPNQTHDSVYYTQMKNVFQLKFNEEANSLLKFGLRAFIENEVQWYTQPGNSTSIVNEDSEVTAIYRSTDTTFINTAVGGQIFKNEGNNFWWNAGAKTYIQGHKIGDSEINGKINTLFPIGKDTAGFFASGNIILRSPSYLIKKYTSNHFAWDNSFNDEKIITIKGGIQIPTRRFALNGEMRLMNDYIYWNSEMMPAQASKAIKAFEISLSQHFKWRGFNSLNKISYQKVSESDILPLPELAVYSANYFEKLAFKVLTFQIGFDVRYFSKYYAPGYMPATSQFYVQNTTKTGDYPFVDVFANFHLKRARIGVKYDHVNEGFPSNNSFLIPGYPNNPRSLKLMISWNFFD